MTRTRHAGRCLSLLILAATLVAAPGRAYGWANLDVRSWLSQPGVKLLAVEFYATWCGPCMKAVPQWKRLHEKYRAKGLRLVVVSVQDQGACASPDWNPDQVICDEDGTLQQAWKAGDLPQAFLWSWQGTMLVSHGHVEQIEKEIEAYFERLPRIMVAAPKDERGNVLDDGEGLKRMVRTELSRVAKLELVADKETMEELRRLRKDGYNPNYDTKTACKLGAEVSPNSRLDITLRTTGSGQTLFLELFSIENGCLTASAKAPVMQGDLDAAVVESVNKLVGMMAGSVTLPGRATTGANPVMIGETDIGETATDWSPEASQMVIANFESEPPGALVLIDGNLLCQDTGKGCSRMVAPGQHRVSMKLEGYADRTETVEIGEGATVRWPLEATFGILTVRSTPPGLPVLVNNREIGQTPIEARRMVPGAYEVLISSPCWFDKGRRFVIRKGEDEMVDLEMIPKIGAIKVGATDVEGNAVAADVYADGAFVGRTPGTFKVNVCTKQVSVQGEAGGWNSPVTVPEQQVVDVEAHLGKGVVAAVATPPSIAQPVATNSGKTAGSAVKPSYQSWTLGVLGGVNVSTYIGDDAPSGAEALIGFAVGPTVNVHVGKGFYLQTELLFTRKGAKQDLLGDGAMKELSLDYLELPLYAKWFTSTKSVQWYAAFGGYVSFLVDHTKLLPDDFLKKVDGGLLLGIGVAFGTPPGTFFMDARYEVGLAKIFDGPSSTDIKLGSFGLYFGLQF
ncbi:MAG: PEGA domain-containing protein [Pseudomonadota bacterium]